MAQFAADPRILYKMARERLEMQLAFFDALDAKVGTMFAAASAIMSLLAAVFALRPEALNRDALIVISIAAFAYFIVSICLGVAYWPRAYDTGPVLEEIWADSQVKAEAILIPELIVDYIYAIRTNDAKGWLKPWVTRVALTAILVETVALAVGLLVVAAV